MNAHEALGGKRPSPLVETKVRRDNQRTVTLLVEAGFDQRFWRMHVHKDCRVEHQGTGGKQAALAQLDEAREHPEVRMLAVLDADLDRLTGRLPLRDDVVWTDGHDLEVTLLGLPVLEKLARQHLHVEELEAGWRTTLRARLFHLGRCFGRLRWARHGGQFSELVFKKPGKGSKRGEVELFDDYVSVLDATDAPRRVVEAVRNYSNAQRLTVETILTALQDLPDVPAAQVCNGHDLIGLLRAILRKNSSSWSQHASCDHLADLVATGCERAWLDTTAMFQTLQAWAARHPGFPVLSAPS